MNITGYLSKNIEIQGKIIDFIDKQNNVEEHFQIFNSIFHDKSILEDKNELKLFLRFIVNIASNHFRGSDFYDKIERILDNIREEIKKHYSNIEIFNIFKSNKRILLYLIKAKIIIFDQYIIKTISSGKYEQRNFPQYFSPEIKFNGSDANKVLIANILTELPKEFEEKRKCGENDSYICKLIQKDSIEEFIIYVNKTKLSLDTRIQPSIYETNSFLMKHNDQSLIEYAAFFGSIRIFNYLLKNKVDLTPSLWNYAIHGRNLKIIHCLEENRIKPEIEIKDDEDKIKKIKSYEKCFYYSIKCHHNEIKNYIQEKYISNEKSRLFILKQCLKYYNFKFIEEDLINQSLFHDLCKYEYVKIVDFLIKKSIIDILNIKIRNSIENYLIFYFLDINNFNQKDIILESAKESKIVAINIYKETDYVYFIVAFEKVVLIINQSSISFLKIILTKESQLKVCFLSNSKNYFDEFLKIDYNEEKIIYGKEINFDSYIKNYRNNQASIRILSCILEYLIQKSYNKLFEKNRIKDFGSNNEEIKEYKEDDYIKLNITWIGSLFCTTLIYLIEEEKILLLKKPFIDDQQTPKLLKREKECYSKLNHPLLPKFYGTVKENIIIEYITGSTLLLFTKNHNLDENDKITIIFQIMIVIKYFHKNKMILRDLKPNNIMIDHNKTVVFIDFDSVICLNNIDNYENVTGGLMSIYIAPEFGNGKFSEKSDIYSLGKIIYYIIINREPKDDNIKQYSDFGKHVILNEIFKNSININPNERMNISEIIYKFYNEYHSQIKINYLEKIMVYNNNFSYIGDFFTPSHGKVMNYFMLNGNKDDSDISYAIGNLLEQKASFSLHQNKIIEYYTSAAIQNQPEAQYKLGIIYYEGKYIKQDIKKAICYLTLAASNNHIQSQFVLSTIYYDGKYIQKDIQKVIHYLILAAKNNHPGAQNNLGSLYYEGEIIQKDVSKAIYYFNLAANQNQRDSQFSLGLIYFEGIYVAQDIQKAIFYYTLAANQYHHEAQFRLGYLYFEGKYVTQNIGKAFKYIFLSAEQNNLNSLNFLGYIYYEGKYISQNVNKAIHYYTTAANLNHSRAQYNLGKIFYEGLYIECDINKSIYYYSLSANNNFIPAQYDLGTIYFMGKCDTILDINKAIYYFTLAANQNHMDSQLFLGSIYYNDYNLRNIDKAIYYYSLAARQNNSAIAQITLGIIYYDGIYVKLNIEKTIYYFTLAANNHNHPHAQFLLGTIYDEGIYVRQDLKKAIHFYSLASNQDYAAAQVNLGKIYHYRKNFLNINKAIHYYLLAANQNDPEAQLLLGFIYIEGKYIKQDIDKAIRYFLLAANQDYPIANSALGDIYSIGRYVPRDINRAIHYYSAAANKNDPYAQYKLGVFYYEGQYVEKDTKKSINYLSLSANQNNKYAQSFLGYVYSRRNSPLYDISKAINYLSIAANQNNRYAQYLLGDIYYYGNDVPKDYKKAIHYYSLASNQNDADSQYKLWRIEYKNQNINKALNYLNLSALNGNKNACFVYGFLNHEGRLIQRNIHEAIKFYKEASCFYNKYAKNNLGILYKNGYGDLIDKNIGLAIEYFKEGIRYKNDIVCKYNLSHIYLYEVTSEENLDESIDLLIDSYKHYSLVFTPLKIILCLLIIKRYGYDIEKIEKSLSEQHKSVENVIFSVIKSIKNYELNFESKYHDLYYKYRKIDFLYNEKFSYFPTNELNLIDKKNIESKENINLCINKDFYEGFGIDLMDKYYG